MLCSLLLAAAPETDAALRAIREVGPDGAGSARAAEAWKQLTAAGVDQLPDVLAAFDGASPLARNWLRSAAATIADRAETLPADALAKFLLDRDRDGEARYLAYELLKQADAETPARFLPKMLDDPSPELRRDAVDRVTGEAEKLLEAEKKDQARALFREAFASARDQRQVVTLAKQLRDLGEEIDLARHLGLIRTWKLVGPFDYDPADDDPVYAPEETIDLAAEYEGKGGDTITWKDHASDDDLALVNLNEALGAGTKQVAYATTEFVSDQARDAQVRLGSYTKFQLWLNGEMVLDRADAYTGMRLDHYQTPVKLKEGKNVILVKVYQAEPPEQLPQKLWQFMLRVCTPEGVGILSTDRAKG